MLTASRAAAEGSTAATQDESGSQPAISGAAAAKVVKPSARLLATPIITSEHIEKAAKSVSTTLVLEDDVKAGIMLYLEGFVDELIKDTAHAAKLRKSSKVTSKDVDFALRSKLNGAL